MVKIISLTLIIAVGIIIILWLTGNRAVLLAACRLSGGDHLNGMTGRSCVYKTADGGKECRDGKECESGCLLELTKEESDIIQQGGKIEKAGKCAETKPVFGCFSYLSDGKIIRGLCTD